MVGLARAVEDEGVDLEAEFGREAEEEGAGVRVEDRVADV